MQSREDSIFGKSNLRSEAGLKRPCKSVAQAAGANPLCPKCKSKKTWRNGHRHALFGEPIKRYICCDCGYRFSDPEDVASAKKALQDAKHIESIVPEELKSEHALVTNCQICDEKTSKFSVNPAKGTENLVTELINEKLVVPQKEAYDKKDLKGAIIEFLYYLQKKSRTRTTCVPYYYDLQFLVKNGANLFDPANVKSILETQLRDKTEVRKYNLVKAYSAFMKAYGLNGTFQNYSAARLKEVYLPPESHLDTMIAACYGEMPAFLQTLKETAARPIEAMRILWDEVDLNQNIIQINHPAKKCNSRSIRISSKLHDMLMHLPKNRQKIFKYKNEKVAGKTFREMRKRAITKLGIKELRKITLYTFRYWRATVEYQETGKEGAVMILLGHKSTKYIYKYVQLAQIYFGGEKKYISLWVYTREQETKAVEEGYDLVRTDPKDGASLYRKLDRKASAHFIGSS